MTKEELNYIKDAFSQIIEDIAGNPDWHEAERAVASDFGTLERELEKKVASLPSNLDEAAEEWCKTNNKGIALSADKKSHYLAEGRAAFKAGAEWMAGQGRTVDGTFHHSRGYPSVIELKTYLRDYEGADVIVQIRKKQ